MGNNYFFSKLVTKNLTAVDSNRRLFEGILTVEMKDRQGEITVRDELLKVLPIWIARGGPITDTHSNRVVGQGINFGATSVKDKSGKEYPAISIQGEIFKDYELDNEIWNSIKSGKYKGLSFGGATKSNRTPIMEKDGSVAYSLKDLEQYEVAVCEEPAVPLALITQHNEIAKAMAGNSKDRGDGTMCIRCDKFKCYVEATKNGEPLSDVTGENAPEGRDEQASGLKRLTAEELEEERGVDQDNGVTYNGTNKARKVADTAEYGPTSEVDVDQSPGTPVVKDEKEDSDEKAMDVDDKEMLEEAGLTEEKKLEDNITKKEDPIDPVYTETDSKGNKVDQYGNKMPKIMSKKPQEEEVKDKPGTRHSTRQSGIGEEQQPTEMSPEQLRARQTRLNKPKVGGKNVKWSPTVTHDKETGNTTIDSTGKPRNTPGGMGKITIPTKRYIDNYTKSLDMLNMLFSIKADVKPDSSYKPSKTELVDRNRNNDIEDMGDKASPSKQKPGKHAMLDELNHTVGSIFNNEKPGSTSDRSVASPKVGRRGMMSYDTTLARKLTSAKLNSLREEFLLKTDYNKATCYNTDEVVREYEDDEKKAHLDRRTRKYSFDEVQAMLYDLLKSADEQKLHDHTGTADSITNNHFVTSDGRITNPLKDEHDATVRDLGHGSLESYLHNTGSARVVHSDVGGNKELNVHSHKPLTDKQTRTIRRHVHEHRLRGDQVNFDNYTNEIGGVNAAHDHNSGKFPKARHNNIFNSESFDGSKHGSHYKNAGEKYPGLTPKQRKLQLEIDNEKSEDPYAKEPEICKTNTDARTYTEPGRGGFAGREPGETCDRNESTSIHDVTQPKHVNESTNEEGANGLKKVAGDPQLGANNGEDGIKGKFRLDNDPPAESFEKSDKPNPAGWDRNESKQRPGRYPATDEHHAMVLGKVPPSSVVGSKEHDEAQSPSNESEMNMERYNHGMNQSLEEADANKSTNINDPGHGSGGVRSGAAYDNAQQDTGAKDNPRDVKQEEYTGEEDTGNNSRNIDDIKADEEETPKGLKKASIILDLLTHNMKNSNI